MLKLTATDYRTLYDIVFRDDYPGYKPNVVESPAGDGVKDAEKRYAHVSYEYLKQFLPDSVAIPNFTSRSESSAFFEQDTHRRQMYKVLDTYLRRCHEAALDVAIQLGIPRQFWPDIRYSALRVLEYPPGAGSAQHTDFDLFTLNLYRNKESLMVTEQHSGHSWLPDGVHSGEMLTLITGEAFEATPHEVHPHYHLTQYSLVYFAMPNETAVLPSGQTCGEWVAERKKRSRYDA